MWDLHASVENRVQEPTGGVERILGLFWITHDVRTKATLDSSSKIFMFARRSYLFAVRGKDGLVLAAAGIDVIM